MRPTVNPPPTAPNHLPGLDLLRAVAISLVLCYHIKVLFHHPEALDKWSSFGWTGVDLFFVLSGFLISSQLLAARDSNGINLKSYFIKRGFRILPLYWLMLAVYFLLPSWREVQSPAPLWKFLSFTQNLGLDITSNRSFSHAWSLCIEEQFYLLLPLVLIIAGQRVRLRTMLVAVLSLMLSGLLVRHLSWQYFVAPSLSAENAASSAWVRPWGAWIYYPTQSRLDGLLTGVLIASVFHWRPRIKDWCLNHATLFLSLGSALLFCGWLLASPMRSQTCALFGYPVVSLAYGTLLIAALSPSLQLPKFVAPIVVWLATLSYGIYLSHKITGHLIEGYLLRLGLGERSWWLFAAIVIGCVLTALLLHFAVERPAFRLRDWLLKRTRLASSQRTHPSA